MHRQLASAPRLLRLSTQSVSRQPVASPAAKLGNNSPCFFCQHRRSSYTQLSRSCVARISQTRSATTSSSARLNPSEEPSSYPEHNDPYSVEDPAVQTPDITNHYTIFPKTLPNGPPPASPFDISVSNLRREFLALQALMHPDKYPGPSKRRAEALSARINEAYRTLSDPLARAQYLLAMKHGVDVTAEDGAQAHPQDQETLMQVLEVQEAVEEAEDERTIQDLKTENEERMDDTIRALGEAINRDDVDNAVKECVRLRFWYSISDVLREWEPGHGTVRLIH